MKKRILSVSLVLCMLAGMFPTSVLGLELERRSAYTAMDRVEEAVGYEAEADPQEGVETLEVDALTVEAHDVDSLSSGVATIASSSFEGEGDNESPYVIKTSDDLVNMASLVNSSDSHYRTAYYILMPDENSPSGTDFDVTDRDLVIGTKASSFQGKFDGNNCTIKVDSTRDYSSTVNPVLGLFGTVDGSAIIQNVTVSGNISFNYSAVTTGANNATLIYAGALVGSLGANATLINCHAEQAAVRVNAQTTSTYSTSTTYYWYTQTFTDGSASKTITTDDYIRNYSKVGDTPSESYAGGLVGYNQGTLINCGVDNQSSATAEAEAQISPIATVSSTSSEPAKTTNSATAYSGGLIGYNASGKIYNSYSHANVTADSAVSKTALPSLGSSLDYKDYDSSLSANLGSTTSSLPGTTTHQYASATTGPTGAGADGQAYAYVGGLIGKDSSGTVFNSYYSGGLLETITNSDAIYSTSSYNHSSARGGISGSGTPTSTNAFWYDGNEVAGSTGVVRRANYVSVSSGSDTEDSLTSGVVFDNGSGNLTINTEVTSYTDSFNSDGRLLNERYLKSILAEWVENYATPTSSSFAYGSKSHDGTAYGYYQLRQWFNDNGSTTYGNQTNFSNYRRVNIYFEHTGTTAPSTSDVVLSYSGDSNANADFAPAGTQVNIDINVEKVNGLSTYRVDDVKVFRADYYVDAKDAEGEISYLFGEIDVYKDTSIENEYSFEMPDCGVIILLETTQISSSTNCTCDKTGFTAIVSEYQLANMKEGGKYYLNANIEVENYDTISLNNAELCLNGFNITSTKDSGAVLTVEGTSTICDTSGLGTISHSSSLKVGTGILVKSGELTIKGGKISNNDIGIQVDTGTLIVEYTGVTGSRYLEVSGNNSGIIMKDSTKLYLNSGTVRDNDTAGITVSSSTSVYMSGNPKVDADGNGLYLPAGRNIELTGALESSAEVTVTRDNTHYTETDEEYNKLVVANGATTAELIDAAKRFESIDKKPVFYRPTTNTIYVAPVLPMAQDFELVTETNYSLSDSTYNAYFVLSNPYTFNSGTGRQFKQGLTAIAYDADSAAGYWGDKTLHYIHLAAAYIDTGLTGFGFSVKYLINGEYTTTMPEDAGKYEVYAVVNTGVAYFSSTPVKIAEYTITPVVLDVNGGFVVTTEEDSYGYTGSAITPQVKVLVTASPFDTGTVYIPQESYEMKWSNNTAITTSAVAYAWADSDSVNEYNTLGKKCSPVNFYFDGSDLFTIKGDETILTIENRTSLENNSHLYGETFSITVTPTQANTGVGVGPTSSHYEVSLYVVGLDGKLTEIGTAVNESDANGKYTLYYDTGDKDLVIGSNTLVVDFSVTTFGVANLENQIAYLEIDLMAKELTAEVPSYSRPYNGSQDIELDLKLFPAETADSAVEQGYLEFGDDVTATAYGYVASADANYYTMIIEDVVLSGDDIAYYTLDKDLVDTKTQIQITKKDLSTVAKQLDVEVLLGVGTFATPTLSYTDDYGNEVLVPGVLTYTDAVYTSYDEIVAQLKTMAVRETLTVTYSFVPDDMDNYFYAENIRGNVVFTVVNIKFSGIDSAIVIPETPLYGGINNFFYDPSEFVAQVGSGTTTGAYSLQITDSLGTVITDYSLFKVGTYHYYVSFTSYDSAYVDVDVVTGSFTVEKLPVVIEWDATSFSYDSTEKLPTATITNIVWIDDVSIVVTGAQKNVGGYTAQLALAGADKGNYELNTNAISFTIEPGTASGILTVNPTDTDGDGILSTGDVLTADVTSVYPAGGSIFYHWYRDGILLSSATWPTYTLSSGDKSGSAIQCKVTFSGNTVGEIYSAEMVVGNEFLTGSVAISHAAGVLTATVSGANTSEYTIFWTGVTSSATGETYDMNLADYDNVITVTVIAQENSDFCGSFSNTITVDSMKPFAPEIAVEAGDTIAEVTWETVFHGGSALIEYNLTVVDIDGEHVQGSPFKIDPEETSYTVEGLENSTLYSFQLAAKNAVGSSYSLAVESTPGITDTETDSEGNIVTTTTISFEDADGSTVTQTLTTEVSGETDYTTTTLETTTVSPEGVVTTETTVEVVDAEGNLVEYASEYAYTSDILTITAETYVDDETSEGSIVAETKVRDNMELPVSLVETLMDKEEVSLTVLTPNADIVFDGLALETIFASVKYDSDSVLEIFAEYTSPDALYYTVQERLATAFIMDLTVKVDGVVVSDFGGGTAKITIPYNKAEANKAVSVYYVSELGAMTAMLDANYDALTKTVSFTATHFSYYAILEETTNFIDVYSTDYFFNAVVWAVDGGITTGTTDYTFSPHAICTRAQAMTLLWNAMGREVANVYNPFYDVFVTDYYYDAVRWAFSRGITDGTGEGGFSPEALCTRAQIVTFLWIANGRPLVEDELYFSDVALGGWYTDAVRWAVSEGITSGTGETTFSPDKACTRAEIITFLYSALGM